MFYSICFAKFWDTSLYSNMNVYDQLGLKENCSTRDVERSWKRYIHYKENHQPFSKKMEEQSRKIEAAYGVLSDPSLKSLYDKFGYSYLERTNFSIYEYYTLNEVSEMQRMEAENALRFLKFGGLITFPLQFKLKDFMNGAKKNVSLLRTVPCVCKLGGNKCYKCRTNPYMSERIEYTVELPKGANEQHRILGKNISDICTKDARGACDVLFIAYAKKEGSFSRKDQDLYLNISVPLVDIFGEGNFEFDNADGEKLSIPLVNVHHLDTIKIEGKGFPYPFDASKRGDLYVTVHIEFPKSLSDNQKEELRKILPDE